MFVLSIKKKSLIFALIFTFIFLFSGGYLLISFANNTGDVQLPILMYHSILKSKSKTGTYVITPSALESDMKYLKEKGYETVLPREVISYVKNNTPLPEKPVILSFDDGCLNNLTYLYPLLEKYEMKAAIAVVGEFTDRYSNNPDRNPDYACLSWNDISFLSNSGKVEILNHTYNLHNTGSRKGASQKKGESQDHYCNVFKDDINKMQNALNQKCSINATTFVYPFGGVCKSSLELVRQLKFDASFTCREKINTINHDKNCLFQLGRYNRSGKYTTDYIMKKIGI